MIPRAILPLLCAAALTLAALPGFARVGVVVGLAPPAPVVEAVPAPTAPGYVLAARLLELERLPVCLGARRVCRASLCSRGMGARKLGPARRRLGVGPWPLAALAGVRSVEPGLGPPQAHLEIESARKSGWPPAQD